MFCAKCGQSLPDGSKFCYKCGWKVPPMEDEAEAQENAGLSDSYYRFDVSPSDNFVGNIQH